MRITIRPSTSPGLEIDVTQALTAAVAHELWRHGGGNEVLNWLEAERLIATLATAQPTRHKSPSRDTSRSKAPASARPLRRKRTETARDGERITGPLPILGPR